MGFSVGNMSDQDLTAIISWLRTRPPVAQQAPAGEWGPVAKALSLILRPRELPPMADIAPDAVGLERGRYLANGPAACVGCHTPANPMTFAVEGAPFSGNSAPSPDETDPAWEFLTPNLTPDPATGLVSAWSDSAEGRFRRAIGAPGFSRWSAPVRARRGCRRDLSRTAPRSGREAALPPRAA